MLVAQGGEERACSESHADTHWIWLRVEIAGIASCHVGYRSCFYRSIPVGPLGETPIILTLEEKAKVFDPVAVYGHAPNPTQL